MTHRYMDPEFECMAMQIKAYGYIRNKFVVWKHFEGSYIQYRFNNMYSVD